jgi:hypothetical protein
MLKFEGVARAGSNYQKGLQNDAGKGKFDWFADSYLWT